MGHHVLILTRGQRAIVSTDPDDERVNRVRLRVPWGTFRSWVAFLLLIPVTLLQLQLLLNRHRIRVVMIQYAVPGHFYFGILRWFGSWRLFATFQGDDAHGIGTYNRVYSLLCYVLLRSVDGVTAVSRSLLAKVQASVPAITTYTAIVPNGAPRVLPVADGADACADAITVGLLQHRKGIDVLIRALGILKRRGVRQRVLIVGEGEEREALVALAKSESVEDEAIFLGAKPHAEVLSLLQGSRYLALASRAEGLPLVVVEAMMCGRPVVATNIDGIPEIVVHESSGLLVEPDSPIQLANAMQRMTENDEICASDGSAASRTAQAFEWRHIAARYVRFFEGSMFAYPPTGRPTDAPSRAAVQNLRNGSFQTDESRSKQHE